LKKNSPKFGREKTKEWGEGVTLTRRGRIRTWMN